MVQASARRPLPRIAVTLGDPAGVGPEICLRLLADPSIAAACRPIVFGSASLLRRVAARTGLPAPERIVASVEEADQGPCVLDLGGLDADAVEPGRVAAVCGHAAFEACVAAIDAALAGRVAAVATAPACKEALHAAGHRYPGHTEIFAERLRAPRTCMMQYSEIVTCSFVTTHVGYAEVPALLTTGRILDVIELTHDALTRLRGRPPRLGVCGLNPHAGEHGLFGDREEERVILPAIERARAAGMTVAGPLPADTAFTPKARASHDAVVCMYHDQGHIPVKALAFESAVNTTLGLSVPRTSVDHGTAFDIAWKGEADPTSLLHAVRLAVRLAAGGAG
jgi:4-hydroxythreonine-4-phosphate dehydrogenase